MRGLIDDGRIHLFDGAMGTLLYSRGVFVNVCYDELNLSRPDLVRRIHEEYAEAGAEILETNTFGANPIKLSAYGLAERTEEINAAAARLARAASGGGARVAGAIGPLGVRIEPLGPTSIPEAIAFFARQAAGLLEGGIDGFVLETFSDLTEIECAFRAIRDQSDLPIVAQMTVEQDGKTVYGKSARQLAIALTALGPEVIGLNCAVGPAVMLDAIEDMAEVTALPLSAQPNAGLPRNVGDRKMYLASPEYMAQYARRMIDVGVRFVGGCCGTTPEHTRKLRQEVGAVQVRPAPTVVAAPIQRDVETSGTPTAPVPLSERSEWGRKLALGTPLVSVEIVPPHGWDPDAVLGPARALHQAGVDAVAITDTPRSRSRMGAAWAALLVEREVGIETVVRYSCEGPMLGMISDLLGAAAAGLRNIVIVSGDPSPLGPFPDANTTSDIDSIGFTAVVQGMNRGVDPGGNSIGAPTPFVQGVAVNQGAIDLVRELRRFAQKVEAGADFAVTQPAFDRDAIERFLASAGGRIPVIATIWPLVSQRNAEFLANEMPGIRIPKVLLDRMERAQRSGPEAALEEGVRIAVELVEELRPVVQGFHLGAPSRRVDLPLRILAETGLRVELRPGPGSS